MMKSDNQLYEQIMEKLKYELSIDASNVTLAVNQGVVKIAGTVESYPQKKLIERAISSIQGVKGIVEELEVNLLESFKRDDADIANVVLQALEWNMFVPHEKIQVIVEHGCVTLKGEVQYGFQRQSAEKAVRNLMGVTAVNNDISIKWPGLQIIPNEVKEKIRKEFERNALIDSQRIQVEINDEKITLQGTVRSWAEYREANHAAWSIPGVKQVDNLLAVTYLSS